MRKRGLQALSFGKEGKLVSGYCNLVGGIPHLVDFLNCSLLKVVDEVIRDFCCIQNKYPNLLRLSNNCV